MAGSFTGINTMSSALRAFQTQLDVTGDNVANSETVGFHRRTVALKENPSTSLWVGSGITVGNGVNVAAVSRVRDMFLAARRNEAGSKLGRQQEALTGLSKVQDALMEPGDDGISAAYGAFNDAWSALSASPSAVAAKTEVQAAGRKLASKVSGLATSLQTQRMDNVANVKDILGKIDAATAKIANLNTEIAKATARGGTPNDLLDARDATVKELSGYADVTTSLGDGNVSVSLNGFQLVTPSGATTIADKFDPTTGKIVSGSNTFPVGGGSLAGAMDVGRAIDATAAKLDTFADTLRAQVNGLFTTGKLADGTTGVPFFAEPTPPATKIGADELRLSDPVAADPNAIAAGTTGLAGDGTLAAGISSLRDQKLAGLGNQTLGSYYAGLVSDVGGGVAAAQDATDTQSAVAKQIDAQISSTDSVSMDDEMANLLRFQRAYQAAAKALTTFDSMTETIINMLQR